MVDKNSVIATMITFGLFMAMMGGMFAYSYNTIVEQQEPYREVTIKVAAFPSETSNVSEDNVTQFSNLNEHEQEMFLQSVEEADTSFEESSMRFEVDVATHAFEDTRAVEYGGAVYPVFLVENQVVGDNVGKFSLVPFVTIGFIGGTLFGFLISLQQPRHRRL